MNENNELNKFLEYYNLLTDYNKRYLRTTLDYCYEITNTTFYRKLKKNTWTKAEKEMLARLINIDITKIFPGEENKPILKIIN